MSSLPILKFAPPIRAIRGEESVFRSPSPRVTGGTYGHEWPRTAEDTVGFPPAFRGKTRYHFSAMSSNLTIRDVPADVIEALRRRAQQDGSSIEEAAALLLSEAVDFSRDERAAVEHEWAEEVERRLDATDANQVALLDGEEVFREAKAEVDAASGDHGEDAA
jgi:plasmid stability protein